MVIQAVENVSADEMRQLVDVLRRKQPANLAVLLATAADGKVQLVAGLSSDLVERGLHAGNWLKEVAPIAGGGGGGRADLARLAANRPKRSRQRSSMRSPRSRSGSRPEPAANDPRERELRDRLS